MEKKRKIRAITPFKVNEVGINRKLTDILSRRPIVSELSQLIVQILNTFCETPFGGLDAMYHVHLGLTGKRRSRLPNSVNFFARCYG